jgi:hypothetical protein
MVCPFDRAQALEQRQRDQAIAAQLAQVRPIGPSRTHCLDCEKPISENCAANAANATAPAPKWIRRSWPSW